MCVCVFTRCADLKHEALRERHWRELMQKCGQEFTTSPESMSLEKIFAMELHRFKDVIIEIVTAASKEMSIEKVRFLSPFMCFILPLLVYVKVVSSGGIRINY